MSRARTQLLASGLLIVTFAVGCLFGAAWDRVLSARQPVPRKAETVEQKAPDQRGSKTRASLIDARMLDQIGVTTAQRAIIDSILDVREREAKRLWKEWEPRFNAMIQQTRGQVRAQLTAEQIKQLDALIAERRALHKEGVAPQKPRTPPESKGQKHTPAPSEENRESAPRRFESVAL